VAKFFGFIRGCLNELRVGAVDFLWLGAAWSGIILALLIMTVIFTPFGTGPLVHEVKKRFKRRESGRLSKNHRKSHTEPARLSSD